MAADATRRRRLLAAVLVALALASCGGGDDEGAEPVEPDPSGAETGSAAEAEAGDDAEVEQAILDGYRAGWEAFQEAMDPPDPDHPALAATSTGRALEQTRQYLTEIRDRGNVLRGAMELAPEIRERSGRRAVLWDCVQDSAAELPADSPERSGTPTPVGWEVHMALVDGTWVQEVLYEKEAVCAEP